MKHHSQVFIALFALIVIMSMFPLQEGYTNAQTQLAKTYSDNSDNTVQTQNTPNWLSSDIGGSSTEFKFSDKFNNKFKNPIVDTNLSTINKPDFKLYDYYWPL